MKGLVHLPSRHPNPSLLLAYACGNLTSAHGYVVATHISACGQCRGAVRAAEQAGGIMLRDLPPAEIRPEILNACLRQLSLVQQQGDDAARIQPFPVPVHSPPKMIGDIELPRPLQHLTPRKVRVLAPGIKHATLLKDDEATLHLIQVRPGVKLPSHTHLGLELTCVIKGAFHDSRGRYRLGDIAEGGEEDDDDPDQDEPDHEHLVMADPPQECVCVMATTGRLRFKGWFARLLQPLMPF